MDRETLDLSWKLFPTHLALTFKDILKVGNFADVTLVSDYQIQTPAHKIVLSACSPVLKAFCLTIPTNIP
jgi:hypothetical protein